MKKIIFSMALIAMIASANGQVNSNNNQEALYIEQHQKALEKIKEKITVWQNTLQTNELTKEEQTLILKTFSALTEIDESLLEIYKKTVIFKNETLDEYSGLLKTSEKIMTEYNKLVEEHNILINKNTELKAEIKRLKNQ